MFVFPRFCATASMLLMATAAMGQQIKPRTEEEIRKDIQRTQQRAVELEAELAAVINQPPQPFPDNGEFRVGAVYVFAGSGSAFTAVKAVDVLSPDEVLVAFETNRTLWPTQFLMKMPTVGLADGAYIQNARLKAWKYTGTKRIQGRTVYVLETAGPAVPKARKQ